MNDNAPTATGRQSDPLLRRVQATDRAHDDLSNGTLPSESASVLRKPSSDRPQPQTVWAIATALLAPPTTLYTTLLLIFGGCCSNVYTLEALVSASSTSGSLITALQFLLAALFSLPSQLTFDPSRRLPSIRLRQIPIRKWLVYTILFLLINILNNTAFKYQISVPLHIILRSAGPVSTMAIGRLVGGRRYSRQKVVAVLLLFAGVVCAAISDAQSKRSARSATQLNATMTSASAQTATWTTQAPGFVLLTLALILSALMGLFTDDMFSTYGRSNQVTSESLFYSHALSLPYFFARYPLLASQYRTLISTAAPQPAIFSSLIASPKSDLLQPLTQLLQHIPTVPVLLLLNAVTQFVCVTGVNQLSTRSSALTVGIVLNIRKLVSLLLSIWLFGNKLPPGVLVGAGIVFLGGGLYALPADFKSGIDKSALPRKHGINEKDE